MAIHPGQLISRDSMRAQLDHLPPGKIRDFCIKNPGRRGRGFSAAHIPDEKHILYTRDPEHPQLVLPIGVRLVQFHVMQEQEATDC